MQTWLWFAFLASFAVKLPMWPVHTWLPDAHVEAPTAGSVILAGILLKMGGYGFLRFSIPMFPLASAEFAPLIFALSVVAIIYTSLVALAQEDMKKLIAYSSVAHMGFVTIGVFTLTMQGLQGGIFQMLSHGIVSAALFLCVGVIYDRMHTREIAAFGGLVDRMPLYAFCFMVFTLANVGLPGTSGFVGEFLALTGAFRVNTWVAFLATTGIILSAGLRALALSPRHLRQAGEAEPQIHQGPDLARGRGDDAARAAHHLLRLLSRADARCVRRLGRGADQELSRRALPPPSRRGLRSCRKDLRMCPSRSISKRMLPELILAIGAMALLMLGVFTQARARRADPVAVASCCSRLPASSSRAAAARPLCSTTASSSIPSRAC